MMARVTNLQLGEFIHTLGDAHLYVNHLEQAKLQVARVPFDLPKMLINPEIKSIFDFKYEDFCLTDLIKRKLTSLNDMNDNIINEIIEERERQHQ